ncbi:zinc finger protein [Macleaya cordata]|uniref:Zinc finger protein n=1 Tax=Macleaya cordata TaxID=56857 RepID=A0A200QU84_MACCD|nr:zinc finger protein [Macleaya cordata]
MSVAKVRSCNSLDAMKSGQKIGMPDEGNDSLDNFIRQAIGKEPVLSFSKADDIPVQWIQLLSSLNPQVADLSGWPLLSPKVPMQKCDKCAREFCSPINYRRHIRVHRRSLKIDKDSTKLRDFLGAFWDKLSLDEAKEIVSFNNVMLEEVPGSSIVRALTSFIRKPGFFSLPQSYVKAGAALLDLIQARPSRFPISSEEFFTILDDASEKTFLFPGTAVSMQKFMFDGEPGKIGLEMKNLIACTSFLVEQKLVREWLVDKDAEALRCQKLLVEEEEAAQKRQIELLERRRLKKLRQKEQKAKEQVDEEESDLKEASSDSLEVSPSFTSLAIQQATSNSKSHILESLSTVQSFLDPVLLPDTDEEGFNNADIDMASDTANSTNHQNFDHHRLQQGSGQRRTRRPQPSSQRGEQNGFHSGHALPVSKLGAIQKRGMYRDHRATSLSNSHKVWTRKTKLDNEREDLNGRVRKESRDIPVQDDNCELLIGSISVTLGDCSSSQFKVDIDHQPPRQSIIIQEKPVKPDSGQNGINRSKMKLWRPVGRHEVGISMAAQSEKKDAEEEIHTPVDKNCVPCDASDGCSALDRMDSSTVLEEADPRGLRLFSSRAAEAFLAQRWKEAIAADHVKLVLSPEAEPPGCPENQEDAQVVAPISSSDCCNRSILCSAENRLAAVNSLERTNTGPIKVAKFRAKPERGYKLKYIPKQRNFT